MRISSSLGIWILVLVSPVANAQDPLPARATFVDLETRCTRIRQALERDSASAADDRGVLVNLHLCPGGATNFAHAMLRTKTSRDTALLGAIAWGARFHSTAESLDAAMTIAADRDAAPEARAHAIAVLLAVQSGLHVAHRSLMGYDAPPLPEVGIPVAYECHPGIHVSQTHRPEVPAELRSAERLDAIRRLGYRLSADSSEIAMVRSAAWCLR